MKNLNYDTDDLIAALATPWGESALAVIRTSGKNCIEAVSAVFEDSGKMKNAEGNTLLKGYIIDPDTGVRADEVVAGIYRNPKSYTGEDLVEIYTMEVFPESGLLLLLLKRQASGMQAPVNLHSVLFLIKKWTLPKLKLFMK